MKFTFSTASDASLPRLRAIVVNQDSLPADLEASAVEGAKAARFTGKTGLPGVGGGRGTGRRRRQDGGAVHLPNLPAPHHGRAVPLSGRPMPPVRACRSCPSGPAHQPHSASRRRLPADGQARRHVCHRAESRNARERPRSARRDRDWNARHPARWKHRPGFPCREYPRFPRGPSR